MAARSVLRYAALAGLFLAGAWLIFASAAERYADLRPVALLPPGSPLAANSALVHADRARRAGDLAGAQGLALQAVRSEPLNQDALGLVGQIALELGQAKAAAAVFLMSAQLGWREPLTQMYWFQVALGSGDLDVAAQRLEALGRTGWNREVVQRMLAAMEASPGGRSALADRLAIEAGWADLWRLAPLSDRELANRAALLTELAGRSVPIDPDLAGQLSYQLVDRGQAAAARALWLRLAARGVSGKALVLDGGFEASGILAAAQDAPSPFVWRLEQASGIFASVEQAPPPLDGRALQIRSETTSSARTIRQVLALRPGRYALGWRQSGRGIEMLPRLSCADGGSDIAVSPEPGPDGRYRFAVAQARCAGQNLEFVARSAVTGEAQAWIDDIEIVAVTGD